ncbi:MAG TPA: hypothetical protein VLT82_01525 [Myxococcaceae bacterium]|nr:hypothetical protein [Myxococcaceae bacterium]
MPRHGPEGTSLDLFNWAAIGRFLGLVGRSMARHKVVLVLVWFGVVGATVGLMAVLPKTYEVQTTLQAQRAEVIAALSGRGSGGEVDIPSKQAAETVLRHDNLIALIQQTDLIKRWPERRAPLLRVKDALWARLFAPQTKDEVLENFVGLLEKRLWVDNTEGTVSIGIHFPDGELAYRLVDAALENFLEARHAAEISSIGDAIVVLENRAAKSREALDETRAQLENLRAARASKLGKVVRRPVAPAPGTTLDPQISQLLVQVQSRRRAIADLQEFRRRRVTELEAKLEELRALYSPSHPAVLDLEQSLEAMRKESPQVVTLQRELAPLEAELNTRGLMSDVPLRTSRAREGLGALGLEAEDPREAEDPDIEYAKSQVRHAITRYNALLDRVEAARLEQDSAQAAFKYRYTIIRPAQKPRGPIKPKPALIIPASIVAGLFLAVFSTALIDLWSRKLVEPWQVEHTLGIPLLGEIRGL